MESDKADVVTRLKLNHLLAMPRGENLECVLPRQDNDDKFDVSRSKIVLWVNHIGGWSWNPQG